MRHIVVALIGVVLLALPSLTTAGPGPGNRGGGWGPRGQWGSNWNPKTVVSTSGTVVRIEHITPYRGMSPGVHIVLKTGTETISVHLGPAWFVENQEWNLEAGDRISVRGSRIMFSQKPALIAAEVRRGSDVFLLRDEDGYPLWAAWRARS